MCAWKFNLMKSNFAIIKIVFNEVVLNNEKLEANFVILKYAKLQEKKQKHIFHVYVEIIWMKIIRNA